MAKTILVRKIALTSLMDALQELYNAGIDFVDMYGEVGKENDSIYLSFTKDYMDEEFKDQFEDIHIAEPKPDQQVNVKLSDEDLNQLA